MPNHRFSIAVLAAVSLLLVAGARGAEAPTPHPRAHAVRTLALHVHAPAATALAAFTPTKEAHWSPGWHPVFSRPDHADEAGSVFLTDGPSDQVIWLLNRYDLSRGVIEYVEVQPRRTLTLIHVAVLSDGARASLVQVTYAKTSLSPAGDSDVHHFASHFATQREHWERALNAFVQLHE